MKLKKFLKIGLPIASTPLLALTTIACNNKTEGESLVVTHANGTISNYSSFDEAVAHITNGDTLQLDSNVQASDAILAKSLNNITIDGNGYNLTFKDTYNASSLFAFENCYNVTITNIYILGNGGSAINLKNSNATINNVITYGNFVNTLYIGDGSCADVSNCAFVDETLTNKTTQTIYVDTNTLGVVKLDNVTADSLFINKQHFLDFGTVVKMSHDINMRYILVDKDTSYNPCSLMELKIGINGLNCAKNLWFAGYEEKDENGNLTGMCTSITNTTRIAEYVFNAKGLKYFNAMYRNLNAVEDTTHHELHLMGDIDYNPQENGYWIPLHTGNTQTQTKSAIADCPYTIDLFDGHGFTIYNLEMNGQSIDDSLKDHANWNCAGFFGQVGNTTTQNVTFDNCRLETVTAPVSTEAVGYKYQNAGFVYGYVRGNASLINVTVSNSYIGAKQKVGSLVGVVGSGYSAGKVEHMEDIEDQTKIAWLTISGCISDNNTVINKCVPEGTKDIDIYLGGLIGWLEYHRDPEVQDGVLIANYTGSLTIDQDSAHKTYLKDIHFNWQQEYSDKISNFDTAILFLYGHYDEEGHKYRQCNSFSNVVVSYSGE